MAKLQESRFRRGIERESWREGRKIGKAFHVFARARAPTRKTKKKARHVVAEGDAVISFFVSFATRKPCKPKSNKIENEERETILCGKERERKKKVYIQEKLTISRCLIFRGFYAV